MTVERIETGIEGFDELIEGGFPRKSCILLSGMPGTGKTIFGLQYLCHGASNGEKGLYVTFEQNMDDLISNVGAFEWGIPALMDTGNLELLSMDIGEFKIDELVKK
ncbi:MAG: circadian clock protein KaiC, partial [Candidatus Altiarchaeota archaeon]|nr:circadian clock protein KaiC [Candidatus Altiarchaeota archaeon]